MADGDGKRPELLVEERAERGSRATRRLRRDGLVPGVLYGGTVEEPISFKVPARELRQILVDGAALFDLKVGGGKAHPVIIKEQQFHPVRGNVEHIDLLEVNLAEKIHAQVSIELEGAEEAPGITEGGVLEQATREIDIEALPTDIPEKIVVDVSGLDIAATLTLAEITAPQGVTFLAENPEEVTIATVVVPTEIEEPEEVEEETVLVGEEGEPLEGEELEAALAAKAAAEEGEEGEPAPEGEGPPAEGESSEE
jgi:large subunit ribosomal protein L25